MTVSTSAFEWKTILLVDLIEEVGPIEPGYVTSKGWRLEFKHIDPLKVGWVATRKKEDLVVDDHKEARTFRGVISKECLIDLVTNIEMVLTTQEWVKGGGVDGFSVEGEDWSTEKVITEACALMRQDEYQVEIRSGLIMFRDPAIVDIGRAE